jgi:hypothetical protein
MSSKYVTFLNLSMLKYFQKLVFQFTWVYTKEKSKPAGEYYDDYRKNQ